jgi:hypothetical protein
MTDPRNPDVRLEDDHVAPAVPYGFLALVVLFSVALSIGAWLLLRTTPEWADARAPVPVQAPNTIAGIRQTPILEEQPAQRLYRAQREALGSWGWVDRDAGIVQIPIDEAVRLLVEEQAGAR